MDKKGNREIQRILDLTYRHKTLIILSVVIALVAGLEYYVRAPKVYRASAIIMYQRQKINPAVMSPDVRTQTRLFVANISQQITSREKLEKIIKKFGLYKEYLKRHPIEDAVVMMREKHIHISAQKGDTFTVSFQGPSPKKVMLVTNELASKFVEENLRYREQRATETAKYIDNELKMAKETLDKKEKAIARFKLEHFNELPERLKSNIGRLNSLQEQYRKLQELIQQNEQTKAMLKEQMAQSKEGPTDLTTNDIDTSMSKRELERRLALLRTRYTENHPLIKRIKKAIEEQGRLRSSTPAETSGEDTEDQSIAQLDLQIKKLKQEEKALKEEIKKYQTWIKNAPMVEAKWAELTRDYAQFKDHYEKLVAKKIQAESVKNLEQQQKGTQLSIIEYAHQPDKPYQPDFKKIMAVALIIGLGIGGGLSFLLELMDTTFSNPDEIEEYLGLPVVCSIPFVLTKRARLKKRLKNALYFSVATGSVLCLVALFVFHWHRGDIIF